MTNFGKVGHFMKTFGQEIKNKPGLSTEKINKLRVSLINEELEEFKNNNNLRPPQIIMDIIINKTKYFYIDSGFIELIFSIIEYNKYDDSHKIQNLLKLLKNSGFQYRLFKHLPLEIKSFNDSGNIYACKINN